MEQEDMVEKTIYIIRHGLIRSNVQQVYSGRSDEHLTEKGMKQAEELGREIKEWGISTFYVSPLRRTMQTAEILNKHVGGKLIVDADLIEMELGPWTGLSKDEVATRFPLPYRTWVQTPAAFKWDGMESLDDIQERVARFLCHFGNERPERVAAAVTHAVVVKAAFLYCNKLDLNAYHTIPAPNLSVHQVSISISGCTTVRIR